MDIGSAYRMMMGPDTLKAVAAQRTAEANGAAPVFIPYVPEKVDENTTPDMVEAHDYYYKDAPHPNSPNKMLFTCCDRIFAYSSFDQIETLLTQPLLLIAGSKADTLMISEDAYQRAKGEKELLVVEGGTHIDFYDKPEYVNQAVTKASGFFGKNL